MEFTEIRFCKPCNKYKTATDFFKHKRTGYTGRCKVCAGNAQRRYRATKPKVGRRGPLPKYTEEDKKRIRKEYRAKYKKTEEGKAAARRYVNKKRKTNPTYRLKKQMCTRIWEMLRQNKAKRTMEYVGCALDELKSHLEAQFTEGMTWDNYGEWHVDHIKPLAAFSNLLDEQQQKIAFHYTNLQPLWAKDNLRKSAKLDWNKEKENA